jgi:polar amino acid transport system substrate-binding protein
MLSFLCSQAYAAPLKFCYEDSQQLPWTNSDGKGLIFALLQNVETRLGEQFVSVPRPWKTCQEEVRAGKFDGFFSSAVSNARREYSVFPSFADGSINTEAELYEEEFGVYLRRGASASWNGKELRSATPVVVQGGYVVGAMVRERGLEIDDTSKTAEDGLALLSQNHADMAILQGANTENLMRSDPRFNAVITKAGTPFIVLSLYLAINKNTYAVDPKRIDAIWNTIAAVRRTPQYVKLLEAAGVH